MDIPRLAFSSDLVLSALLGIAALHYSALRPEDGQLSYAAGYYFDRAVRNHRLALKNVDEKSAEGVLATAILITHHTWVSAHSLRFEPYELPLQVYYMARGIDTLFQQMWPWSRGSGYLWYVDRIPISDQEEISHDDPFLHSSQQDLTRLSDALNRMAISTRDMAIYEEAMREIYLMCQAISNKDSPVVLQRRVATMPVRLSGKFLDMLKAKDPAALAILARNLCLLNAIESVWWLHGSGPSQKVAENSILGIAKMIPDQWSWAMEWPSLVLAGALGPRLYPVNHES